MVIGGECFVGKKNEFIYTLLSYLSNLTCAKRSQSLRRLDPKGQEQAQAIILQVAWRCQNLAGTVEMFGFPSFSI